MKAKGLTIPEVERRAGFKKDYLRDVLSKGQSTPSIENMAKLARGLGVTLAELYEGVVSSPVEVGVAGHVMDAGIWEYSAPNEARTIALPLFDRDQIAVEVRSKDYQPAFRYGDLLIGAKSIGSNLGNLIGRECIIETSDDARMIGFILKSPRPKYHIVRSILPSQPDIEARVRWAAPITVIIRDQR